MEKQSEFKKSNFLNMKKIRWVIIDEICISYVYYMCGEGGKEMWVRLLVLIDIKSAINKKVLLLLID